MVLTYQIKRLVEVPDNHHRSGGIPVCLLFALRARAMSRVTLPTWAQAVTSRACDFCWRKSSISLAVVA